jgi:hypothetical protein
MRKRWLIRAGIVVAAVALAFVIYRTTASLNVTVANEGTSPMTAVVVRVADQSYPLGDIPPGGSRSVRVDPAAPSHLEMDFAAALGRQVRLNVGGSLQPGSRGTITVHVKDGSIVKVEGIPPSGTR